MAIQTREYELTVWSETLNTDGTKTEKRLGVIGAHDMSYLGRATNIHFVTKLNGTHTISFQMPDKYFDSEKGEFVQNELRDLVTNERKVKLHYKNQWHEFFIKNVNQQKKYKSYMYDYSGTDAYIDELARNGYNIIFDTELYNNVEEIGVFTEEILDGSQWSYSPENNVGDFTEYIEEKLFRIPVSQFKNSVVPGYKINFEINELPEAIVNAYTNKKRTLEMGDDLARINDYYWDNYTSGSSDQHSDKGFKIIDNNVISEIPNDGYIYVPYSQLGFCYTTTGNEENYLPATEEPKIGTINGITSYYVAPTTIDPTAFIQFIAIPNKAEVEIDEAGLLVNKNYIYVMTVEQWNDNIKGDNWYLFEKDKDKSNDYNKQIVNNDDDDNKFYGNKYTTYDGYLSSIDGVEVDKGKKISISNRTEKNISEEIDQYVTVYNNRSSEYADYYSNPDWKGSTSGFRVCSKIDTRQILPQLARNYVQNGINIKSTDGWEVQKTITSTTEEDSATIKFVKDTNDSEDIDGSETYLEVTIGKNADYKCRTIINFGAVGQEKIIEKDKIYCLGLVVKTDDEVESTGISCTIGEGNANSEGDYELSNTISYSFQETNRFILIKPHKTIKNPYICLTFPISGNKNIIKIKEFWFFEAYTKGQDFFPGTDENTVKGKYRYSGRDLLVKDWQVGTSYSSKKLGTKEQALKEVLFETDVMEGATYEYKRYFIQGLYTKIGNTDRTYDTFATKEYTSATDFVPNNGGLPLDASNFSEDDYEIITNYINLNSCKYYAGNTVASGCDCSYDGTESGSAASNRVCMYQKYGYCPYLFTTEKHCRRTRTLTSSKSNRFNLTQEVGKIFEIYPIYYIEHNDNGTIKLDENNKPIKKIFYMTEKGKDNKIGFRYEKNLENISKKIISDQIVTKLYVEDNDSELSKTGLCSIKTAEDNPSKDNFIIDLSYYIKQGMLDEQQVLEDLYGIDSNNNYAFLKKLGYYNTQYDKLSNKIINLQNQQFNDLEAQIQVNITGIETAQKEIHKNKKQLARYDNVNTDTYKNYAEKISEQTSILIGLIKDTFYTDNKSENTGMIPTDFLSGDYTLEKIKEEGLGKHTYTKYGLLGQYNTLYLQIQEWKKERAGYLKKINEISEQFFYRYEPYLKEGTWTNSNYLTDNAYYHDAVTVAAQGAIPKVEYSISVTPLGILDEDYDFEIADTTYVEDIGMFGINRKTGFPNRLKVIISELNETVDIPTNDTIGVQNFTTQFEDLFEQVTASVQSLTLNENIYHRSSNFTSLQNVETDSLQGTLDTNDLTLVDTTDSNVKIDATGQSGSDINNHNNKYKLNGQGLFFSNNGGETWNVGVGPSGINADYIKTGTLDAGKIRIVDNDYVYFLWDKGGITAYREPNNNNEFGQDFARFNKYGLSLVENNKIRLRAGYNYTENGTITGRIDNEADFKNSEKNIGFYLYDNSGHSIFSTETSNSQSGEELSARINLTGEMYAKAETDLSTKTIYHYTGGYQLSKQDYYYQIISILSAPPIDIIPTETHKIIKINDNYYEGTIYEKDAVSYTEINDIWYAIGRNNGIIYTFSGDDTHETSVIDNLFPLSTYNVVNMNTNTLTTLSLYHSARISDNYYYSSYAEISPSSSKEKIGVYYNHRAINSPSEEGGYFTRLLSCVKNTTGQTLENIFSILSDGSLYIGGTLTPKNANMAIDNLDNYVQINPGAEGIILSNDGHITIGGLDIQEEVNKRIEEIAAAARNAGLIQHNHTIPALDVNYTISDIKSYMQGSTPNPDKMALSKTANNINLETTFVKIYGAENGDDAPNSLAKDSIHYMSLQEVLNAQSWETAPSETGYTGTVGGSSIYNGSYYSISGIVNVAYEVVQKFYENTIAIGTGYNQSNWIRFIANGNDIYARCDCSGLVSAIWQALGDFETGRAPNTYSMLSGDYPSSWRMIDYNYSSIQPGDVLLAYEHVTFVSDIRDGVLYLYDFGGTSNLEASYYNNYAFWNAGYIKIIRRITDIPTLDNVVTIDRSVYNATAGTDNKNAINFYFTGNMSESFCGPYPDSVNTLNSPACKGLRRIIQSCKGEYGGWIFAAASYAKLYRATIIGNSWINSGANGAKTLESWLSNVYTNRPGWMGTANTGNITYSESDLSLAQAIYNNLRYPHIYGSELHNGSINFKNAIIKAINGVPLFNGWVGYTWAAPPCFAVLFNPETDRDEGMNGQPRGGVYLMYRSASGSIDTFNENIL